ncbi:MAG: hypothetical protein NT096_01335, partial [Proteobacteria bacterium]|nr:hypothetical protein [Pseudomonadota bacterium]
MKLLRLLGMFQLIIPWHPQILLILIYVKLKCLLLTFNSPPLFTNTTHPREINLLHSAFGGERKGGKSRIQKSGVRSQKVGGERQGLGIRGWGLGKNGKIEYRIQESESR